VFSPLCFLSGWFNPEDAIEVWFFDTCAVFPTQTSRCFPPAGSIRSAEAGAFSAFWKTRARQNKNLAEWARAKLDARKSR
jgi:hypothetical protein